MATPARNLVLPAEAVTIHFKRILFTCYLQYNKSFSRLQADFVESTAKFFALFFYTLHKKQGSAALLWHCPRENHFSSGCSITRAMWNGEIQQLILSEWNPFLRLHIGADAVRTGVGHAGT